MYVCICEYRASPKDTMRHRSGALFRHTSVTKNGLTVPLYEAHQRARAHEAPADIGEYRHGFYPRLITPEYDNFLKQYLPRDHTILQPAPSAESLEEMTLPLIESIESHLRTWPATMWRQIGLPNRIFAEIKSMLDPNAPPMPIVQRCVLLYSLFVAYQTRTTSTTSFLLPSDASTANPSAAAPLSFSTPTRGLRAGLPSFALHTDDAAAELLSTLATVFPAVGLLHALLGHDGHVAYASAVHQLLTLSVEAAAVAAGDPFRTRPPPPSLLKVPTDRWDFPAEMESRRMVQPQWRTRAETVKSAPYLLCRSPKRAVFQWQPTWRDFGVMSPVPPAARAAKGAPQADTLAVCVTILRPNRFLWPDQVPYAAGLGEFRRIAAHYACTDPDSVLVRRLVLPPGAADPRSLAALRALCGGLGPLESLAAALPLEPFTDENMAQAVDLERDLNFRYALAPTSSTPTSGVAGAKVVPVYGSPSRRAFAHTTRSGLTHVGSSGADTLAESGGETRRHAEALKGMAPQGGLPVDGGPASGYWG